MPCFSPKHLHVLSNTKTQVAIFLAISRSGVKKNCGNRTKRCYTLYAIRWNLFAVKVENKNYIFSPYKFQFLKTSSGRDVTCINYRTPLKKFFRDINWMSDAINYHKLVGKWISISYASDQQTKRRTYVFIPTSHCLEFLLSFFFLLLYIRNKVADSLFHYTCWFYNLKSTHVKHKVVATIQTSFSCQVSTWPTIQ